jgi:cytochrome b6-f complex iron-sulfur subunit
MRDQPTPQPEDPAGHSVPKHPHRALTRRRLVRLGWLTGILVAVGGQLWILLKLFFAPPPPGEGRGQFLLGPLDTFALGSVTHFRKERLLLVRHQAGVLALSNECTHQKCPIDFLAERNVIFCPCHGAQFSVTGAVLAGPAPRPLERFAVTLQDGYVLVDTTRRSTS